MRHQPRRVDDQPDREADPTVTEIDVPAPQESTYRGMRDRRAEATERALRGLVTTRGTQVSWAAATRARAVSMPSAHDLEAAEREVVLVRRNYTPPEPLRSGRIGPGLAQRFRREPPATAD